MGKLLVADYSQLEYRIACHVWPDPKFQRAAMSGDIHGAVARQMFGDKAEDPETKEEIRVLAKHVNFGTLYGSEGFAVAEQTGLPLTTVQGFIEVFRAEFPGLFRAMEATKFQAIDPGYVTSLTGRRRRFFLRDERSKYKSAQYNHELREALNFPVQGPAAEITLLAMVQVHNWLVANGLRSLLINNVHDCLIVDSPNKEVDTVLENMVQLMEQVPTEETWGFKLVVPLAVEVKVGPSWGEAKEVTNGNSFTKCEGTGGEAGEAGGCNE